MQTSGTVMALRENAAFEQWPEHIYVRVPGKHLPLFWIKFVLFMEIFAWNIGLFVFFNSYLGYSVQNVQRNPKWINNDSFMSIEAISLSSVWKFLAAWKYPITPLGERTKCKTLNCWGSFVVILCNYTSTPKGMQKPTSVTYKFVFPLIVQNALRRLKKKNKKG